MLLRIAAVASAAAAGARAQQSSGQGSWPPECQDVNKPDGVAVVLGGALGDAAQQITYSAADGPNVEAHLIAYDAATTSGGSGGPVFGGAGEVIAVNFAIQRNFDGNNLGVPIRYARELLPE